MTEICLEVPVIQITQSVEGNFNAFNREAEDLDSDWLMQPVAENDYDSETQCLVDTKGGKEGASFADHYVTKRKKRSKRGKAKPAEEQAEQPKIGQRSTLAPIMKVDTLDVPGMSAPAKGVLSNPATRRIACGALPPELRAARNPMVTQGSPPSYEESTKAAGTPPKTFASAKKSPPSPELVPPEEA